MHRISANGQEHVIDVETVEDTEPAIRDLKAGRFEVDEIGADTLAHRLPSPERSTKTSDRLREPGKNSSVFTDRRPVLRAVVHIAKNRSTERARTASNERQTNLRSGSALGARAARDPRDRQ
jgi:hypothetical protein